MECSAPIQRTYVLFLAKGSSSCTAADRMVQINDTMSPGSVQDKIHVLGSELLTKQAISCVVV